MDQIFFENRDYFVKRIQDLESSSISSINNGDTGTATDKPDTAVCIRIRPLTSHEIRQDHIKGVLTDNYGVVNIHEPKIKVNSKPELNSSSFTLDQVYGPEITANDIYEERVQELLQWVQEGGMSMLLAYGQTGSGKTFTVTEIEKIVVSKLMDEESLSKWDVYISIFEVAGVNMCDLLQDRKQIKVLEDSFGTMQLLGILEKNPKSAQQFLNLIDVAKELRTTESTFKNDQSSRSHAICRIRVINKEAPGSPEGSLLLVDLAGSEASSDTQHHSRERMAETREINKSLTVLKECIRTRALWSIAQREAAQKQMHIPFRSTKLTQVLKSAFDVNSAQTCKTIVIACINPSMLDVAHSKNTLRYAEMLKVPIPKAEPRAFDARIPTTWANKYVQEWIRKNSGRPQINPALLAPKEDGTQFCQLKEDEFVRRALLTRGIQPEKARLLYFKLWALHIDSRSLSSSSGSPDEMALPKIAPEKLQRSRVINPGVFFRLRDSFREDDVKIVMVMAPVPGQSIEKEKGFICSAVRPSGETEGAFELFIADQRIVKTPALGEEVSLKYDRKTRYYYIHPHLNPKDSE